MPPSRRRNCRRWRRRWPRPAPRRTPMADLSMIGSSGLNRQGGYVYEPFVRELQGAQGRAIFRQMAEEDPIIGAFLYAVEMLLRRVTFPVVPASEAPSAHAAATLDRKSTRLNSSHVKISYA